MVESEKFSLNRRRFVQSAVLLIANAAGSIACSVESNSSVVQKKVEKLSQPGAIVKTESALVIRQVVENAGKQVVDFGSALRIAPLISALFAQSTNSAESPNSIANQIFVVRGNFPVNRNNTVDMNLEQKLQLPGVQQLIRDYPHVAFPPITISKLIDFFGRGSVHGFVDAEANIFLNLPAINANEPNLSRPWSEYLGDLMYDRIGGAVRCIPATPMVDFVFTQLHELSHRQAVGVGSILLDKDVEQMITRKWPRVQPIGRNGFDVYAIGGFKIVVLDELVADYIAAKISTVNDLWYKPSIGSFPVDLYNFEKILQSSGISDGEFVSMHREGRLRDFLIKIGSSINRERDSDHNLDKGLEVASRISPPLTFLPMHKWEELQAYYPDLDVTNYAYFEPSLLIASGFKSGCTNR